MYYGYAPYVIEYYYIRNRVLLARIDISSYTWFMVLFSYA